MGQALTFSLQKKTSPTSAGPCRYPSLPLRPCLHFPFVSLQSSLHLIALSLLLLSGNYLVFLENNEWQPALVLSGFFHVLSFL